MFEKLKNIIYKILIFLCFFFLITVFIEIPGYILGEYQLNDYRTVGLVILYFLSMLLTYMAFNYMYNKYPLSDDLDSVSFKINFKFLGTLLVFILIRVSWLFIYGWLFNKLGLSLPDNEVALMASEEKMRTLTDFAAIIQAPIFEELLFRKMLMHLFFNSKKSLVSEYAFVLLSSFFLLLYMTKVLDLIFSWHIWLQV